MLILVKFIFYMRKNLIFQTLIFFMILFVLTGCLKNDPKNEMTVFVRALSGYKYTCGNIETNVYYFYDKKNRITKLITKDKSLNQIAFDTVFYNQTSGKIDSIQHFIKKDSLNVYLLSDTYIYFLTNNSLNKIIKKGVFNHQVYTKTYSFTFENNNLISLISTGDPAGNNRSFTNIKYSGNNISTFYFDPIGNGVLFHLQVKELDNYSNVNYFQIPMPDDIIESISARNMVRVTTTTNTDTIPSGTTFISNSYTYNYNATEVLIFSKTINPTFYNGLKEAATYTYYYTIL